MVKTTTAMSLDPAVLTAAKARCKRFGLTLSGTVGELLAGFCELDEMLLIKAAAQFQQYELRPVDVIATLLKAFVEEGEDDKNV